MGAHFIFSAARTIHLALAFCQFFLKKCISVQNKKINATIEYQML